MLTLRKIFPTLRAIALLTVLAVPVCEAEAGEPTQISLAAGFRDPPEVARPSAYYLLLNGYVNREHMDWELGELYEKGIRGLCVFDMGARGPAGTVPEGGPAFMSDEWIDNFAYLLEKAGKLGMDVQLAVSSSWDMGASWVKPEHASKAMYHSSMRTKGPAQFDQVLRFPDIPARSPRDSTGKPLYYSEVATLAIPENKRLDAHEFILELPGPGESRIDHVILYNTKSDDPNRYGPMHLFSKDFSVSVSRVDSSEESFHEILRDSLKPNTKAQRFNFPATAARYVRLRIYNGHNPQFDRVQLGEFEVYSVQGRNVGGSHVADRTAKSAKLISFSSQLGHSGKWTADNINDGSRSGSAGAWSSAGSPSVIVSDTKEIVDLTDRLDPNGRLQWRIPEGSWTITRYICANTGERLKVPSPSSDGLATDHFSSEATEQYIQDLIDRLEKRIGNLKDTPLKQLYLPSYEVRGAVWTEDFTKQFERYRGYDPTKYLPALTGTVITSRDATDRFIYDYRKTLGDLLVDAYYRMASATANRVGLGIEAESGGPGPPVHQVPVDALKALGAIDEMRGEWWPWRQQADSLWVVKETACAAHIYGRRRVHMESFTGFWHWQASPFDLKPSVDRAFCEGMNHVVWHTSSHQPPEAGRPGWVYGAGTHLTPTRIWWPYAKPFIDYLARTSFTLQQGLFVADVCYYYGDQGFNFVPPKHIDPSLGYGYDYDVTNAEVILTRMTVKNGRITLPDGMNYELLVLPDRQDIDLDVLQRIAKVVRAGATVVGPKPTRSNGLHNYQERDRKVRKLANSIWGKCDGKKVFENSYGKGKVIWGRLLREILMSRKIGPDFQFESAETNADIDYIHRRTAEADIYFVSNKTMQRQQINARFRVKGKVPQLFTPDTGEIIDVSDYEQNEQEVSLKLDLSPAGSVFVVFADRSEVAPANKRETVTSDASKIPSPVTLAGPWKVRFSGYAQEPAAQQFDELISWTDHELEEIKYFSGIGTYEKSFDIPAEWLGPDRKLHLDLGRLWAVAKVMLNGRELGILWNPPQRVDITDAAKAGTNTLKV
ncbi:MAG: glycosyl hydrolase, partial [Planctomycetota bacterium]